MEKQTKVLISWMSGTVAGRRGKKTENFVDVINGSPLTAIANLYICLNCHARSWLLLYKYVEGRVVKCEMKCSVTCHNDIPHNCHARKSPLLSCQTDIGRNGEYDTK